MGLKSQVIQILDYNYVPSILAKSFIELLPRLFKIPGVTCFLSEKLTQDFLEKFYGCQRQKGRTNNNPTAHEFLKNTQALHVIDSIRIKEVSGNSIGYRRKSYNLEAVNFLKKDRGIIQVNFMYLHVTTASTAFSGSNYFTVHMINTVI